MSHWWWVLVGRFASFTGSATKSLDSCWAFIWEVAIKLWRARENRSLQFQVSCGRHSMQIYFGRKYMEYEIYFLASSLQMLPVVIWLVHLEKKNNKPKQKKKAEQNEKSLPNQLSLSLVWNTDNIMRYGQGMFVITRVEVCTGIRRSNQLLWHLWWWGGELPSSRKLAFHPRNVLIC